MVVPPSGEAPAADNCGAGRAVPSAIPSEPAQAAELDVADEARTAALQPPLVSAFRWSLQCGERGCRLQSWAAASRALTGAAVAGLSCCSANAIVNRQTVRPSRMSLTPKRVLARPRNRGSPSRHSVLNRG